MKIEKDLVASFDYTLKDDEGTMLDTSDGKEPLSYLHGAGNIISGLENELSGHEAGDSFSAVIEPEDAYGVYSDEMVFTVTRDKFDDPDQVEEGLRFQAQIGGEPRLCTVSKVDGEDVQIDANHPLAGMKLHFDVTVRDVREATAQELEHGHVHEAHHHEDV
ncbi:MAG: peptidylprolyl isomerase [Spirochaetales bacterium]|nr:peptidylprolyl isomerase [Spirochaetales bacterium]